MRWFFLIPALVGLTAINCVKPTEPLKEVEDSLIEEPFFKAIDNTSWSGDIILGTKVPTKAWREASVKSKDYTISVIGDTANVGVTVVWDVTLNVVYDSVDTVPKPAPCYKGNINFRFVKVEKWKLNALSPANIKADSALDVLKIDSVHVQSNTTVISLTNPTALMSVDTWPFTFNVGDLVTISVWGPDSSHAIVLLHTSEDKHRFEWDGTKWVITGVPDTAGVYWCFIDAINRDVIFDKAVMADRTVAWGIPYKVE
ncbi:MAG: hypothetical protein QMD71_04435 [bacterium]|nr:hypothetical protein [bacterium]